MHLSQTMLIRCGDDGYTLPQELSKGLASILSREMASVRFEPGGGFGSSLEFLDDNALNLWMKRLQIAEHLGIKKVILADHEPCGAYEFIYGKLSPQDEHQKHLEAIEIARTFFSVYAPKLQFIAYIQNGEKVERIN
jgi:hypothetical protein